MDTDLGETEPRVAAPWMRAESQLTVQHRLAIAALVTAVSLWIRVAEALPDNRHRR
jgi:hypothetical protein